MKANKFFLGLALIGAILTGCDNTDPVTGPTGDAYVSVQISMASTAGTRAADGGFAAGTVAEQKIDADNSIFLFYDENGKWVTSGQLATQDPATGNVVTGSGADPDHTGDINDYSGDAYIVLSGPDVELRKSKQVLTVVNYSNCESLKQLDLAQALETVTTTAKDPANAGFLMTTSVYVKDEAIVNTTAIISDNIQQDPDDAKANPVKIYIERASAKAELKVSAAQPTVLSGDKQIVVDGVLTTVEITVNGWTLNNVHESTYLVKQLENSWATTDPFTGWNWAENHRSYWAKGYNWTATTNAYNTVYTYKDAKLAVDGDTPMYCYENTVADDNLDNYKNVLIADPNVNTALIAATVVLQGQPAQNLYRYGGIYYTEGNYKALIAKQLNDESFQKDANPIAAGDITIESDKATLAGIKITLADGTYTQVATSLDKATIEAHINANAYVTETTGYANGKCYYQIPVEHLGGRYGMVRNHWYEINITNINRIGEAVYDEKFPIPYLPAQTDDYYLAAEIHVLSWHVVTQDVEL